LIHEQFKLTTSQASFALNNVEEVAPEPDEIAAVKAKRAGSTDYDSVFSQEDLIKELGL